MSCDIDDPTQPHDNDRHPSIEGGHSDIESQPPMSSAADLVNTLRTTTTIARVKDKVPLVEDHFSLAIPSSRVLFRRSNIRVYEQQKSQIILQEKVKQRATDHASEYDDEDVEKDHHYLTITVKQIKTSTYGMTALRAVYFFVAVFVGGFLFIFGLELLLFLFIDLATEVGVTKTKDYDGVAFFGVLLSVPVFVHALGSGMTIASRFIIDTWEGHPLLRTFGNWSDVVTEWMAMVLYIGVAVVTMFVTLFAKRDDWWAVSVLTWFFSVTIFYGFFAGCVVFYEIGATLYLVGELRPDGDKGEMTLRSKLKFALLNAQRYYLSGVKREVYMVDGNLEVPASGSYSQSDVEPYSTFMGLYSRMTQWKPLIGRVFTELVPPKRVWTINEARGISPFVTKNSWSLEKLYCRDRKTNLIAVMKGESALTLSRGRSSFACVILGNLLSLLLFIGILVYLDAPIILIYVCIVLIILCCVPRMRNVTDVFRMYRSIAKKQKEEESMEDASALDENDAQYSSAMYEVHETFRYSTPTDTVCYIVFCLEIIFFFIWPFIHLCILKNTVGAIFFLFLGILSFVRYFLNPAITIQELGTFGSLGIEEEEQRKKSRSDFSGGVSRKEWEAKSRLSEIVGTIDSGKAYQFWNIIFGLLILFFFAVALMAVAQGNAVRSSKDSSSVAGEEINFVHGFEYVANPNLPYPTCTLNTGFDVPIKNRTAKLADYAFLSTVAYVKEGGNTTFLLDEWFGKGNAKEEVEIVSKFKDTQPDSPVSYKFITFTQDKNFGIVTIRGTANLWDVIADAQLWLAAGLFQGLRTLLPIGSAWTPILHKVVDYVSALEGDNLEKVSFYKETTKFVNFLKGTHYEVIQVTGHSLGGGLALITGPQTNSSAIGVSAPNAMLSRGTFDPPLTKNQLNSMTFNIVPNRDIIPMLDDKANLYQKIECRAPGNDFPGCHSIVRSLCEIMVTCGSDGTPVICECSKEYGYPEPMPTTANQTDFTQACLDVGYKPKN